MAKKCCWNRGEEAKLLELYKKGITDLNVLAKELGRKPGAIQKSWKEWELSLSSALQTTATVSLTEDLLTHEEALKVLAGALELLRQRALQFLF